MTVIDQITPYKSKRVKGNSQKWLWFDEKKKKEKLNQRNKLYNKFKKSRLQTD